MSTIQQLEQRIRRLEAELGKQLADARRLGRRVDAIPRQFSLGVQAGALAGKGLYGTTQVNVGAGYGITVNEDDIEVNIAVLHDPVTIGSTLSSIIALDTPGTPQELIANAAIAQGDLWVADATPDMARLPAPGATGYALVSGAASMAWDQTPAWTGEHSFGAGIAFTGASGANELTIPDNLAIALELLDAGGLEYLRIASSDAQPTVTWNAGIADIDFIIRAVGPAGAALGVRGSDGRITLGVLGTGFVQSDATGVLSSAAIQTSDLPALPTPGTLTVATGNNGSAPHTHAITSSSNPGAAAAILASDASGLLQLQGLSLRAAMSPFASALYVPWITLDTAATARFGALTAGNNQPAVYGESDSNNGATGISNSGAGLSGWATSGVGVQAQSTTGTALKAILAGAGADIFECVDSATTVFTVQDGGNVAIGNFTANGLLCVGGDFGALSGTRISVLDTGALSGYNLGEDANNRAAMVWSNTGNYLQLATVSAGTVYGNTVVLRDGSVGFGTSAQFGSGSGVIGIANAGTNPSATPTAAFVLYSDSARAKIREDANRFIVQAAASTKTTGGAPYANDGYVTMVIGGTSVRVMTTA